MGKKERKPSLFTDDKSIYVENPKITSGTSTQI